MGHGFGQEFQRHGLIQREIVGAVDFAHAAFAEQSDDAVAPGQQSSGQEAALRSSRGTVPAWSAAFMRWRRGHGDGGKGFAFDGDAARRAKTAAISHFTRAGGTSGHRCSVRRAEGGPSQRVRFGFRLAVLLKIKGRIGFASSFSFGFAAAAVSLDGESRSPGARVARR